MTKKMWQRKLHTNISVKYYGLIAVFLMFQVIYLFFLYTFVSLLFSLFPFAVTLFPSLPSPLLSLLFSYPSLSSFLFPIFFYNLIENAELQISFLLQHLIVQDLSIIICRLEVSASGCLI